MRRRRWICSPQICMSWEGDTARRATIAITQRTQVIVSAGTGGGPYNTAPRRRLPPKAVAGRLRVKRLQTDNALMKAQVAAGQSHSLPSQLGVKQDKYKR